MEKVLVMDKGVAAEFGHKKEVYEQHGIFYDLCTRGGVVVE